MTTTDRRKDNINKWVGSDNKRQTKTTELPEDNINKWLGSDSKRQKKTTEGGNITWVGIDNMR